MELVYDRAVRRGVDGNQMNGVHREVDGGVFAHTDCCSFQLHLIRWVILKI